MRNTYVMIEKEGRMKGGGIQVTEMRNDSRRNFRMRNEDVEGRVPLMQKKYIGMRNMDVGRKDCRAMNAEEN
jgi:hypothetical protein